MAGEIIAEKLIVEAPEATAAKVEKIASLENRPEQVLPSPEKVKEAAKPLLEKKDDNNIVVTSQAQDWQKKQAAAIDSILSEGLNEVFLKMSPKEQANFKKVGEETVIKIGKLLSETKVKVNKIVALIRKWLKLIPGVNKFFLEQEVKIKADRIMRIKNKF